jgi:heptosyltransferase-2
LPNWVGDVVMATPTLRALRELAGEGALVGVMRPYVADVLGGADWFDDTILYAKKSKHEDERPSVAAGLRWPAVKQRLRNAKLDAIVLLTNSLRTAWMAYSSGAPERIGLAENFRSPLLTTRVYLPRRRGRSIRFPPVIGYLQIAQAAGAAPQPPVMELSTTAADERAADAAWARLGLAPDAVTAVINTGGAFGTAKDWLAIRFAQLAARLATQRGLSVIINCGPSERDAARWIAASARHPRVRSLADEPELPLGLTKAVIRRARLLVTTDSGPRFFGVAFGVPTVTLFGSTGAESNLTYAPCETSVSLGLECQPCMARTCPLGHHRCMQDLTVNRVWAAIQERLGASDESRTARRGPHTFDLSPPNPRRGFRKRLPQSGLVS